MPPSPPFFVSIVIIVIIPYNMCAIESFSGPITPNDDDDDDVTINFVYLMLLRLSRLKQSMQLAFPQQHGECWAQHQRKSGTSLSSHSSFDCRQLSAIYYPSTPHEILIICPYRRFQCNVPLLLLFCQYRTTIVCHLVHPYTRRNK